MKRILLIVVLICASSMAHAQKVFQSGNYKGQSQRTYLTLEGTLLEKYQNKGFNWLALQKESEVFYVSIINEALFEKMVPAEKVVLTDCFKIDSKLWKRKNTKKVEALAIANDNL